MFASQRENAYISLISTMIEFPHEIVLLLLKALALVADGIARSKVTHCFSLVLISPWLYETETKQ